jgi:uncharacterized membrane protein YgdD (TMEM256/DUF423 family)
MARWSALLLTIAGLMGAGGVGLAAWAAHQAGGDLATTGAYFLLLHAGPVAGIAVATRRAALLCGVTALAAGALLFSGDLALLAIAGLKPIPLAAPTGGMTMIAGWIWLAGVGVVDAARAPSR